MSLRFSHRFLLVLNLIATRYLLRSPLRMFLQTRPLRVVSVAERREAAGGGIRNKCTAVMFVNMPSKQTHRAEIQQTVSEQVTAGCLS